MLGCRVRRRTVDDRLPRAVVGLHLVLDGRAAAHHLRDAEVEHAWNGVALAGLGDEDDVRRLQIPVDHPD